MLPTSRPCKTNSARDLRLWALSALVCWALAVVPGCGGDEDTGGAAIGTVAMETLNERLAAAREAAIAAEAEKYAPSDWDYALQGEKKALGEDDAKRIKSKFRSAIRRYEKATTNEAAAASDSRRRQSLVGAGIGTIGPGTQAGLRPVQLRSQTSTSRVTPWLEQLSRDVEFRPVPLARRRPSPSQAARSISWTSSRP